MDTPITPLGVDTSKQHGSEGEKPGVGIGVSFRNLNVHGTYSSDRYQQTVASYFLSLLEPLVRLVRSHKRNQTQILRGFNGTVRSGELLLVLGRPRSGCSTFLKIISGETRGLQVEEQSSISYEDISYVQMHRDFKGDCIYLAELDVHFPELSLGQTLSFAAATRVLGSARKTKALEKAHIASAQFSLDSAFNTRIGNAMIRGLSGGEKRRTSIAEVYISGSQLQCWDNSTRGLDSATALRFVQLVKKRSTIRQSTVLMSIYQASEPIYESFDKVTLLYEGRQIYFGPTSHAAKYFQDLGFVKHPRATTADFLTSITHPAERRVAKGFEDRVPRSAEEFDAAWQRSSYARALLQELAQLTVLSERGASCAVDILRERTLTYYISIRVQLSLCIQRGFQRLRNNYVPTVAGVIGNTVIAIIIGSVYFNLGDDTDAVDKRAVLIFFSLMINAYAPAFERPIVEKHSRYALYHPFTESLASFICDLPNKLATCIMFNVTVYFMTNLRRTAGAFFTFLLFVFATVLTMSMFFRTVGSLSKTMEQTMVPCSMIIIVFTCYTGYVIPIKDMVPWLGWLRRLNPIAYAYESLMVNEFANRSFACARFAPDGPGYQTGTLDNKVCASIGSRSANPVVDGSDFIALKYGFKSSHQWRNLGIIFSMLLILLMIHLIATEYIPAQQSRGEILVFRKRKKERLVKVHDEESGDRNRPMYSPGGKGHMHLTETEAVEQRSEHEVFHWSNVNYSIKSKKETRNILTNIEGWVQPGTLTALMGVTGAGKTSLLDILAGRTRVGVVTGNICLGNKHHGPDFQRKIGYVQQEDIHLPTATVREALEFSAQLRQPKDKTAVEKSAYVDHVIDVLEMGSYAEAVVGAPGEGLNVEQRKRLSIAVEMVARPELLLFMDEPTSGLDSQTAWSICMLLRKLADNCQPILVTIHQPSSKLFDIFDRLLLLDETGRMLYFGDIGPDASTLIGYFERNGSVKCQVGQNPAEWVLDATGCSKDAGTRMEHAEKNWCSVWAASPERQQVLQKLAPLNEAIPNSSVPQRSNTQSQYAAPFLLQFMLVNKRVFQEYWRDPVYIYSKMGLCVSVTLVNGLSFSNTRLDIQGVTNIFFSIFLFTQIFSTIDQQIIPRFSSGRSLFEARERRSKTYAWAVMLAAHIFVELFWQTVAALAIFVSWWYPTGLWRNSDVTLGASERSGLAFGMIWLVNMWISTFSQAVGVGMDHAETAVQVATLFFWLSLVFCGVIVTPNQLPKFWKFVYRSSPLTYFIDGTVVAGLANTQLHCSDIEFLHIEPPSGLSCADYLANYISMAGGYLANPDAMFNCAYCQVKDANAILSFYGVEVRTRWHSFGYLAVYSVFNIAAIFAIYWLVRERRARV
ncbi:AtrD, ABC-transporter [Ophiobolus disseminans]|uniref:AtrD, ABC-transporter n=1 Tax=Ophiobolus disseminans TaxID=1469910 RepID=A0A6A6ZD42_9PLEO|nr:AtrD, ABC-transporter [Ophiobolus disseminans]